MRNLHLLLLIAIWMLYGCAASPVAPPLLTRPSLDQSLASDCDPIGEVPDTNDFDVLLDWVNETLFPKYGKCAIRHHQTVAAWPK